MVLATPVADGGKVLREANSGRKNMTLLNQFAFGIPLRSKDTARSWDTIITLLECTLRSIFNQTDGQFRVILAHHELPILSLLDDSRVVLVRATFPPMISIAEQMADRAQKRRLIGTAFRELGGGYLMFVDADDLVSNQIVAFAHSDADRNGYILKDGYEFDVARERIRAAPRFNRLCGTSAIINFSIDDLPRSYTDNQPCYFSDFQNRSHVLWADTAKQHGRSLTTLPFKGAVYVINHGENWSVQAHNLGWQGLGWKRRLLRAVMQGSRPSTKLQREFNLPDYSELRK